MEHWEPIGEEKKKEDGSAKTDPNQVSENLVKDATLPFTVSQNLSSSHRKSIKHNTEIMANIC